MAKNLILILSTKHVCKEMQMDIGEIPITLTPINGIPIIEFIVDSYKKTQQENDFFVIIDQGKDLFYKFLSKKIIKTPIKTIEVQTNENLNEIILTALEKIPNLSEYDNLIINSGDVLLEDNFSIDKDTIFYDILPESFRWKSFEADKNKITEIISTQKTEYLDKNKVFIDIFLIKNISNFLEVLKNNSNQENSNSFYSVLLKYLEGKDYELKKVDEWGNCRYIDDYYILKKRFTNTRFFNNIEIEKDKAILKKSSKDAEKLLSEIRWYLELPSSLKHYVPQIFEYSMDSKEPFIKMEYYGYPTLGDLYLWSDHNLDVWNHIFNSLFLFIDEMRKYQIKESKEKMNSSFKHIYYDKTINRLEQLKEDPVFSKFFNEKIIINSKEYESLNYYIQKLELLYGKLILDKIPFLSIIHGDFCLANILYDSKNRIIKIVDPRGKFGQYTTYGDFRYELAKLLHSFDGNYELIINDFFEVEQNENKIDYEFFISDKQQQISELFKKRLLKTYSQHEDEINFIEALLFLSMVVLHKDKKQRQLVMLSKGIEKIDKIIKKLEGASEQKMNIIITMAGEGMRFKKIGFDIPKYMIDIKGKTLFEWSLLSLENFFDEKFIFITRKDHNSTEFIREKCSLLGINNFQIKELDYLTEGQAATVLEAKEYIEDPNGEILIYNIDTYVEPSQLTKKDIKGHGWVPCFEAEGDRWSFVKFKENLEVKEITEKIRISKFGTIGLYYFKSLDLFEKCYQKFNFLNNKEQYIAPIYNVLIEDPDTLLYTEVLDKNSVHVLGTPEDIIEFWPEFKQVAEEKKQKLTTS